MLRARAKAAGPGEWIYNIGGWAHQQFTDDPKPFTREELDQIAPDNPVALQESYYQVFLNSRALACFGDRSERARSAGISSKARLCATPRGKPTGVVRGDIAGHARGGEPNFPG